MGTVLTVCRKISGPRSGRLSIRALLTTTLILGLMVADGAGRLLDAARSRSSRPPLCASAVVVDASSGAVLFAKDPDAARAPASLVKMMTQLLVLERLEQGRATLDQALLIPPEVRLVGGSRLRLRPGGQISVGDALRAMAMASANDAALALAIHFGGSERGFVAEMNRRARDLGMDQTHYVNPHGLDRRSEEGSITTARDQAVLARELLSHRLALEIASSPADTILGGRVIRNTNRLLGRVEGVDGLKTGYTGKAGFCLVSTAERNGLRVVSVLLGAPNNRRRFSESTKLLERAYADFERVQVIRRGQDLGHACAVPGGSPPHVRLVAGDDASVLVRTQFRDAVRLEVRAPRVAASPLPAGAPLGELHVMVGDSLAAVVPAVASRAVRRAVLANITEFTSAE